MVPTAFSLLKRLTWQALVFSISSPDFSRSQMMYFARMPSSFTTSNSRFAFFSSTTSSSVWSNSSSSDHSGLLCAYTLVLAFRWAFLNRSTKGCVSDRWNTRSFSLPKLAEKQVTLTATLPLFSPWLLRMSLVMECADPGCPKKGFTSYLQSPTCASSSLNSMTRREGSCGTSMRKTSLSLLPEGLGEVLHLAMSPRERKQATGFWAVGMVMDSTTTYRYPLMAVWGFSSIFKSDGNQQIIKSRCCRQAVSELPPSPHHPLRTIWRARARGVLAVRGGKRGRAMGAGGVVGVFLEYLRTIISCQALFELPIWGVNCGLGCR